MSITVETKHVFDFHGFKKSCLYPAIILFLLGALGIASLSLAMKHAEMIFSIISSIVVEHLTIDSSSFYYLATISYFALFCMAISGCAYLKYEKTPRIMGYVFWGSVATVIGCLISFHLSIVDDGPVQYQSLFHAAAWTLLSIGSTIGMIKIHRG